MAWLHDQRCRPSSSCIKGFSRLQIDIVTEACPFYIGSDTFFPQLPALMQHTSPFTKMILQNSTWNGISSIGAHGCGPAC